MSSEHLDEESAREEPSQGLPPRNQYIYHLDPNIDQYFNDFS